MSDLINVKGLSDLQAFMDQLTPKLEANVMRGGLRAGMNVVKPVAQHAIHSVSGLLAEGLKVGTRSKGGVVTATLRATGPHASLGILVEFGTQAHRIAARQGFLSFDGKFMRQVSHPGARPKPFMRPALDSQAAAAVVATGEYIKERLATKEGLDTSYVRVEGDRL